MRRNPLCIIALLVAVTASTLVNIAPISAPVCKTAAYEFATPQVAGHNAHVLSLTNAAMFSSKSTIPLFVHIPKTANTSVTP